MPFEFQGVVSSLYVLFNSNKGHQKIFTLIDLKLARAVLMYMAKMINIQK